MIEDCSNGSLKAMPCPYYVTSGAKFYFSTHVTAERKKNELILYALRSLIRMRSPKCSVVLFSVLKHSSRSPAACRQSKISGGDG